MLLYLTVILLFYLTGVLADYQTTKVNLARGKMEVNPLLKKNTHWRMLVPFLLVTPLIIIATAVEYYYLSTNQYINEKGSLVYEADVLSAQIASLAVFGILVVGASRAFASISNLFVMKIGKGLPDAVGAVIGWKSHVLVFIVTSLLSLIVVIPAVYLIRQVSFQIAS